MKKLHLQIPYIKTTEQELEDADRRLVSEARRAAESSYAPYSRFHVGAAVRLSNGLIVQGSNQENAAYPSGLCAERTALFYAQSQYPDTPIEAIAIAGHDANGPTPNPLPPCGACRQVMQEVEQRAGKPLRVLLVGSTTCLVIEGIASLLPFSFGKDDLG